MPKPECKDCKSTMQLIDLFDISGHKITRVWFCYDDNRIVDYYVEYR